MLGKNVIIGYDGGDEAYPIVGIFKDPKMAAYDVPALGGTTYLDTTRFPNHVFTGPEVVGADRTEAWAYRKLPGPWLSETTLDEDGVELTTLKRTNILANITPAETIAAGIWTRISRESAEENAYIGKEVKLTRALPGQALKTSERDKQLNAVIGSTITLVETPVDVTTDPNSEYTPYRGSGIVSYKRTRTTPTSALTSYVTKFPTRTNLSIPDVLESITVEWQEASGDGSFDSEWQGWYNGTSASLSGNEAGDAHGSVSLIPELRIDIREIWSKNIPTTGAFFFLPLPVTVTDVLNKLATSALFNATVTQWPVFKPKQHTLVLKGMKVSVQVRVQGSASTAFDSDSTTWDKSEGSGSSQDISLSVNTVRLPATIHGTITLSNTSKTKTATAAATAQWLGINFPTINVSESKTVEAAASVMPASLAATSPSSVPSSGLYLVDHKIEPYDYAYAFCYAEVLDASIFA